MKFTQAVLFIALFGTLSVANADVTAGSNLAPVTNCGALAAGTTQTSKADTIRKVDSIAGKQSSSQDQKSQDTTGAVKDGA